MKKSARFVAVAMMLTVISTVTLTSGTTTAFLAPAPTRHDNIASKSASTSTSTALSAASHDTTRRQAFTAAAGAALGVLWSPTAPAHATYSAYTRREEDWQERRTKDEINFGTAKSLRTQLAEIAPQNTERSRIFCPNGPSAAVSPLMENRCGDQMATPSVFGRTEDVLGNSIPGFTEGYSFSKASGAEIGGMPEYGFTVTASGRKGK